ncbi:MAG: hypothetical protein A2W27_00040 [Deltaproteobacteria bacterium RBG_16_44_11]|nr:MAG: hypothetical protein A2W27_00040 [Deltaproteobacteria bacterium RBG_16_44_11]
MTDDMEERKKLYSNTRQDLLTRNLSNSERYDNAILALSTGILALSLAFIKDIVPLDKSLYIFLLITSWCLFGLAIVSTLVSFVLSQFAIKRQLKYAEKYYLDKEDEYLKKENPLATLTDFANYTAGVFFVIGVITTIVFVSVNIQGGNNMTKQLIKDAASVPSLQKVQTETEKRGATIPELQPVKTPAPSTQESNSQSSQSSGTVKKE